MAASPRETSPGHPGAASPRIPPRRGAETRGLIAAAYHHRGVLTVASVALGLALWRVAYIYAGIDPDSDAYGHHAIARQILVTPRDLTVHWVWLPFFHYAQALAVAAGATMQHVRLFNAAVAAVTPATLYLLLCDHRAPDPDRRWDPAPLLAALIAALSPIAMQMGTTAQTESLFAWTVLLTLLALVRGRPGLAALALSIAVMLRYEAWAVPAALAVFLVLARLPFVRARLPAFDRVSSFGPGSFARERVRAVLPVVLPIATIFAWAALRRATIDPTWFHFFAETRQFANVAIGAKSSFALGPKQVLADIGFYAWQVPWRVVGYPLLLVPFGIVRTFRREGLRFSGVYAALLAFVTLTWLMRSSLGLDRHFVVLVPFYATLIANGIVSIGAFVDSALRRPTAVSVHTFAVSGAFRAAVIAGLACAVLGNTWSILEVWMRDWRGASEYAWPDRKAIAASLRELPPGRVFCDEPTVEVMSELPRERFDRRTLDDPRAHAWITEALERDAGRPVYVATWAVKLPRLALNARVLARTPGTTGDTGFVLVRVE